MHGRFNKNECVIIEIFISVEIKPKGLLCIVIEYFLYAKSLGRHLDTSILCRFDPLKRVK